MLKVSNTYYSSPLKIIWKVETIVILASRATGVICTMLYFIFYFWCQSLKFWAETCLFDSLHTLRCHSPVCSEASIVLTVSLSSSHICRKSQKASWRRWCPSFVLGVESKFSKQQECKKHKTRRHIGEKLRGWGGEGVSGLRPSEAQGTAWVKRGRHETAWHVQKLSRLILLGCWVAESRTTVGGRSRSPGAQPGHQATVHRFDPESDGQLWKRWSSCHLELGVASATQSQWTRTAELTQGHVSSERHLLESGHLAASNKKLTNASVRKGKSLLVHGIEKSRGFWPPGHCV